MIDEYRLQPAPCTLAEDSLAGIGVTGANIQQPREPKIVTIPQPPVEASGQDFEQLNILRA
jgi:hypothetical protein